MTRNTTADHLLLSDNHVTEAILPASDTGRAAAPSLPLDWRQMIGGILLLAGVGLIVAAWVGASGAATIGDQLSYISSGGLGGLGLMALGVMFVVMKEHAQDRATLTELTAHLASMEEQVAQLLGAEVVNPATMTRTDTETLDPVAVENSELLGIEDVTVRFGGVVANNKVSMVCREHEVTALLGPNGAGKSTLFDVITGARRPLEGTVRFRGHDITRYQPYQRARLGIARSFQNLSLARELTVFDNVLLGAAPFRTYGLLSAMLALPRVRRNDRVLFEITGRAIDVVGLADVAYRRAGDLPFGDLHRVELARALAMSPTLLMLDEPSAGLDREESKQLADALRRIQREWDVSILVVEHDLEFVQAVGDHAVVLDFGQVIASGPVRTVLRDPAVREAYLGTVDHA